MLSRLIADLALGLVDCSLQTTSDVARVLLVAQGLVLAVEGVVASKLLELLPRVLLGFFRCVYGSNVLA